MKVKIYMDDLRPCPKGFLLARTTTECIRLLTEHKGNVEILSLDHDMTLQDNDGTWVVHAMIDNELYADKVYLHTANGEGRITMYSWLTNAVKHGVLPAHMEVHMNMGPWTIPPEDWTEGSYVEWE